MAIHVGVAYATASRQIWLKLDMPEDSTVQDAIAKSGILGRFPEIDLAAQKVGVHGRVVPLATKLADGDRVEIYRQITADPAKILGRDD